MKKLMILLVFTQALNVSAQITHEKEITTKVEKVTVFFENAQITREKNISVLPGKSSLKFVNLSPFINSKSVQVKVNGSVTVLSVNHQQNFLDSLEKPEELAALESTFESIQERIKLEQAHISVIDEETLFLQENRKIGGKNQELSVSNLKETSEFYSTRLTILKLKRIERMNTLANLREELVKVNNQINSISTKKEFPSGEVIVTLDSRSDEKIFVELSYLVDNAGWHPSYDIRAKSVEDPLEIVYKANVHQDTKVDWENVKLSFSSNNPSLSGVAPELKPYYLNYNTVPPSYKSIISNVSGKVFDRSGNPLIGASVLVTGSTIGTITDMNGYYSIAIPPSASSLQYSYIGYSTREIPFSNEVHNVFLEEDLISLNEIAVTGYAMADDEMMAPALQSKAAGISKAKSMQPMKIRGTSSLALPTVQQRNQTSFEFGIAMPYSVKSNSKNYVVDMTAYEVPAYYEYYCIPRIDKDAFLIGNVTNWEQYNLLEGEANIFFEETYIGKTILDVRFISDTLTISLGRDKGVVVNREKIKDLSSKRFIGTKKEEIRAWRISIRNTKPQAINMVLLDQVPVPVLEEIELDVKDLSGGKRNKETGEIKWELSLDPNESKEVDLRYSLKYPKHRNLVFD
ncbi:MAG: mucoidy inhibitor MuiA family protein [Bacteroidales bacterium]|nr:mucoidy inhibitor MuiA family protein [Bacteroidales bacterium]